MTTRQTRSYLPLAGRVVYSQGRQGRLFGSSQLEQVVARCQK
jgi:hypothetical protein